MVCFAAAGRRSSSTRRTAARPWSRRGARSGREWSGRRCPCRPIRVKAPWLVSSETSVEIFSEMRPPDSTTGVKPRPTPKGLNSTLTWPVVSSPDGDRELAAGQELGRFAGDGGQVGLGQGAHQADPLEGLDRGVGLVEAGAADRGLTGRDRRLAAIVAAATDDRRRAGLARSADCIGMHFRLLRGVELVGRRSSRRAARR